MGLSAFGGGGSKTEALPTPAQNQLTESQVRLAEFQLRQLQMLSRRQRSATQFGLQGFRDFEASMEGFTGEATPEQQALLDQAYADALAAGESDIRAFQTQQTEQLREELAPSLGLMPGDTPVLDRGADIAAESARQQGDLVSQLSAQKANDSLTYPLAAQGFQAQLAQNAFNNRLQLLGQTANIGLGLAGAASPNPGFYGPTSSKTTEYLGADDILGGLGGLLVGLGGLSSSREIKENFSSVDEGAILEAIRSLPVEKWTYKGDDKARIGPMAEDFRDAFGLGDGKTIDIATYLGVLTAAVKALANG